MTNELSAVVSSVAACMGERPDVHVAVAAVRSVDRDTHCRWREAEHWVHSGHDRMRNNLEAKGLRRGGDVLGSIVECWAVEFSGVPRREPCFC